MTVDYAEINRNWLKHKRKPKPKGLPKGLPKPWPPPEHGLPPDEVLRGLSEKEETKAPEEKVQLILPTLQGEFIESSQEEN